MRFKASLLAALLGGTSTFVNAIPLSRGIKDAEVFTEAMGPWLTECQAQYGG
jgi:hypothetical protein